MRFFHYFIFICSLFLSASTASAFYILHAGPISVGTGGSNPISIPPQLIEYEFVIVTEKKSEWTIGLTPGIFYGMRSTLDEGFYSSFGGGLVTSSGGMGVGVYGALGYEFCPFFMCFNIEYKQAVGVARSVLSPFAIRIGISLFR